MVEEEESSTLVNLIFMTVHDSFYSCDPIWKSGELCTFLAGDFNFGA
jgi:hypothetical protein